MAGIVTKLGKPVVAFSVLEQSDYIDAVVLAANTVETKAIPANKNFVLMSCSGGFDFYCKFANESIAIPAADIANGTAPELNPVMRAINGKSFASFISANACVITLSYYT